MFLTGQLLFKNQFYYLCKADREALQSVKEYKKKAQRQE